MIAALCVRSDSIYRGRADCFDLERDCRSYRGSAPVVAHPPCRAWGRLRHFAKPRPDEMDVGRYCVDAVRKYGGVLEHPESSMLWRDQGMAAPGAGLDEFGGWTLPVSQKWWGHKAEKRTWLYIVGVKPADIAAPFFFLHEATHTVGKYSGRDRSRQRPELSKADRERTPPLFAEWLIDLALRCVP